jgi:hypothetical protein
MVDGRDPPPSPAAESQTEIAQTTPIGGPTIRVSSTILLVPVEFMPTSQPKFRSFICEICVICG